MKVRAIAGGAVLFILGFAFGGGWKSTLAQGGSEQQAWEIYHSAFGQSSFYVVKHNRITGQTWVLSGERGAKDDPWLLLPEIDKRHTQKP